MNNRERMLSVILIGIVGGGALLFGVVFWFMKPLGQYNASILALNAEIEQKQFEIDTYQMNRRKLTLARAKSLSSTPADATNEYHSYLHHVMTDNGLSVENITASTAARMKFQPTVPGIKEVGHQVMSFTVRARGDLESLVGAMEVMRGTAYEHRIKNLTVDRTDMIRDSKDANPRLHINMVIETLLVAKSQSKSGIPPGFDAKYLILDSLAARGGVPTGWGMLGSIVAIKNSMPTPDSRSYYEIAKKNIFTGPIQITKTVKEYVKPKERDNTPPPPPPPPPPVGPNPLKYSHLTHTDPVQKTAYWFNRVFRSLEQKLVAKKGSGYEHLLIRDEAGEYTWLKAKILRVDLRAVYFQKDRTMYAWHIGTTLEEALENELDIDQRDDLDLQFDEQYAKDCAEAEEKEKAKSKTSKKTPTKKTKGGRE